MKKQEDFRPRHTVAFDATARSGRKSLSSIKLNQVDSEPLT